MAASTTSGESWASRMAFTSPLVAPEKVRIWANVAPRDDEQLEQGAEAPGHVLGRLGLEGLDVHHPGAEPLVGRELLPALGVLHAPVGEL